MWDVLDRLGEGIVQGVALGESKVLELPLGVIGYLVSTTLTLFVLWGTIEEKGGSTAAL